MVMMMMMMMRLNSTLVCLQHVRIDIKYESFLYVCRSGPRTSGLGGRGGGGGGGTCPPAPPPGSAYVYVFRSKLSYGTYLPNMRYGYWRCRLDHSK